MKKRKPADSHLQVFLFLYKNKKVKGEEKTERTYGEL